MSDSKYCPGTLPKGLDPFHRSREDKSTRAPPTSRGSEDGSGPTSSPLPSGTRPILTALPTSLQGATERTGEKPRGPYPFLTAPAG